MNYITEILAFYDYIEGNPQMTDTCICLWHALMYQANKTGWQNEFSAAISTLKLRTGLSKDAIYRARNKLKQFGIIDFKERGANQSATYTINSSASFKQTQSATQSATQDAAQGAAESASEPANNNKQNKTKRNNTPKSPDDAGELRQRQVAEVLAYLNSKANKKYNGGVKKNREHISGRLSDGRTVEELKYVIDVKCEDWLNNAEFNKNLNPVTLFRPANFDRYVNQRMKNPAMGGQKPKFEEI